MAAEAAAAALSDVEVNLLDEPETMPEEKHGVLPAPSEPDIDDIGLDDDPGMNLSVPFRKSQELAHPPPALEDLEDDIVNPP